MPTTIEWTDATWNPVVGCEKVGSPGCDHCYAIDVAHRAMQPAHVGLTVRRPGDRPDWSGVVRCLPERLDLPLRWRKPRRIFVNSMSDLFHPDVPVAFIADVFAVMAIAEQHTFQVLTKRPQRMAAVLDSDVFRDAMQEAVWARETHLFAGFVPANVWLGTSIENQRYAFRANHLRDAPAAVRFLSVEPLLGPVELDLTGIDWVILGGESGPGARPMDPAWALSIRDQCQAADVPFFFKQWGEHIQHIGHLDREGRFVTIDGEPWSGPCHGASTRWDEPAIDGQGRPIFERVGKKAAGRELDGRTWDEYPT
jgi:protein gp37